MITKLSDSSWIKIKHLDQVIYFDPGFMGSFKTYQLQKSEFNEPGDIIFITHAHQDHLQPVLLTNIIKKDSAIIAPKCCESIINRTFHIVEPGDQWFEKGINIQVVDSYNTKEGHSTVKAHHRGVGVGYIVRIDNITFYHAGDTDVIPEMNYFPPIDIAFLPIGGTYTMDISEAVNATQIIQPKTIIPMHFLNADPEQFKKLVEKQSTTKVIVFNPGESIDM